MSPPRRSVLLVMPPGSGRRSATRALRGAGYRVRAAREPYEGTARFVERPADLVVLSLERFRARDTAFVATVKQHAPEARILLLVPEGRRTAALTALQAGADAYAPEPFYPDELLAMAGALLAGAGAGEGEEAKAAARTVGRLAGEVAHAINNPLQILALLGESADVPDEVRRGLAEEVRRIRAVVRILGHYGLLRRPRRSDEPLGALLTKSLEAAEGDGSVHREGAAVAAGPPVSVDGTQAGAAFDSMIAFLVARASERPVPVSARVRALGGKHPAAVEAALRARGVRLGSDALAALKDSVLLTRDETREVYPGLALPAAVAHNHGGRFVARASAQGTVLGLRLPLRAGGA